jgi:hypothetical protein
MERIEYRTVDKSTWPRGAWDQEPDKVQWIDEATGLDCLIVRNGGGALCGYVGVGPSHPSHQQDYNDVDVDVHGGLTFSDTCADASRENFVRWQQSVPSMRLEAARHPHGDAARRLAEVGHLEDDFDGWQRWMESVAICHLPQSGQPDRVWWLGFDCAHLGDISPAYDGLRRSGYGDDTYKDIGYVTNEVTRLASQLAALTGEVRDK